MVSPPDPEQVAPKPAPDALRDDVERALNERHQEQLAADEIVRVELRTGRDAGWLRARVGTLEHAWEMELCATDVTGEGLEGALGVLVDWFDGALEEWLANERTGWVSVAWNTRTYDGTTLWARGEVRDFAAEAAADEWLAKA